MRQRLDIYIGRKLSFERELQKLKEWKTSQHNKELITTWHNHLFATGSNQLRVAKLSSQIRKIAYQLGKDLDKVTKSDIDSLIAQFNQEPSWAEATKADYRRCIKQFYLWYRDEDPEFLQGNVDKIQFYRHIEKHIKRAYKEETYDYSEIINEEDIRKVIDKGGISIKEKAFLSVLHESGFRASEMLNICLKDLEFKPDRVVIHVDGKTGVRRVPLVKSMGYLTRWLDQHPFKDDKNAFLWVGENHRFMYQPLRHIGAQKLIKRCFARANVKKKHNLHWFRHSRATLNAPHLTEVILCKFFGWSIGSRQVRRYVHSNVIQVEDAVMRMNGLQKEKEILKQPIQCSCGMINESEARFCHQCGKPLNAAILMQEEERKEEAIDEAFKLMEQIISNPELKTKFEEFKNKHLNVASK